MSISGKETGNLSLEDLAKELESLDDDETRAFMDGLPDRKMKELRRYLLKRQFNSDNYDDVLNYECKLKLHLPLSQVRDKPGKPWVAYKCNGCGKSAVALTQFLKCSRCKAVRYCNRECQMKDWRGDGKGVTQPRSHKDMCKEMLHVNQEFESNEKCGMALRKALFKSWADQHHADGSFFDAEFRARRGILGQNEVGFWARPCLLSTTVGPFKASGADFVGFKNGSCLLEEELPSLKEGWKVLKKSEYPPSLPLSKPPPDNGIQYWEQYFRYRELSPTSIAPLLLSYVLTIYQMLYHELELPKKKKQLTVYLLGVEKELNFIPLFGELAYLMPGVDLEIVMLSPAAKEICNEAKRHPKSILARSHNFTVLDQRDNVRGGRVRIRLESDHEYLHELEGDSFLTFLTTCDAVIGLNAGIASYPTWNQTIGGILGVKKPFVFSEHTHISLRFVQTVWFPHLLLNTGIPMPVTDIKLNPFNGVINRDMAVALVPNINNGYLLIWKGN